MEMEVRAVENNIKHIVIRKASLRKTWLNEIALKSNLMKEEEFTRLEHFLGKRMQNSSKEINVPRTPSKHHESYSESCLYITLGLDKSNKKSMRKIFIWYLISILTGAFVAVLLLYMFGLT
jgi:hypothetical protein